MAECNKCKEKCSEMQMAGLRQGLEFLKTIEVEKNSEKDVWHVVDSMKGILDCGCVANDYLKKRLSYMSNKSFYAIGNSVDKGSMEAIKVLCTEIEVFIKESES